MSKADVWLNPIVVDDSDGYHYEHGYREPRYPVPATEIDNALAMPPERVSFLVKLMLLNLNRRME